MEKFRFFPHTADTKFQAYGKTMEEAFANAGEALFSIITDTGKVKPLTKKGISAKGHDLKSLLYNYLEELLFLLDTENLLLNRIEKLVIHKKEEKYLLEAVFVGDIYSESYDTHGDVKAITYNQMEIKEERDKVIVQVVPDL